MFKITEYFKIIKTLPGSFSIRVIKVESLKYLYEIIGYEKVEVKLNKCFHLFYYYNLLIYFILQFSGFWENLSKNNARKIILNIFYRFQDEDRRYLILFYLLFIYFFKMLSKKRIW